jgi:hypothetical protein
VIQSSCRYGCFFVIFKGPKARVIKGLIVIGFSLVGIIIIILRSLPNPGGIDKTYTRHNYGLHAVLWENNCLGHAIKTRVFRRVFGLRHFLGKTLAFRGHLLAPTVSEANREG